MPQEQSKASKIMNAAASAASDREADRDSGPSYAGQYCPHCGKHSLAPPGSDLDDAQVMNSIRKLQK